MHSGSILVVKWINHNTRHLQDVNKQLQTLKWVSGIHTRGYIPYLHPPPVGYAGAPPLGVPRLLPATPQAHVGEKLTLRSHLGVPLALPQLSLIHQMPTRCSIPGEDAQPSLGKGLL